MSNSARKLATWNTAGLHEMEQAFSYFYRCGIHVVTLQEVRWDAAECQRATVIAALYHYTLFFSPTETRPDGATINGLCTAVTDSCNAKWIKQPDGCDPLRSLFVEVPRHACLAWAITAILWALGPSLRALCAKPTLRHLWLTQVYRHLIKDLSGICLLSPCPRR